MQDPFEVALSVEQLPVRPIGVQTTAPPEWPLSAVTRHAESTLLPVQVADATLKFFPARYLGALNSKSFLFGQ